MFRANKLKKKKFVNLPCAFGSDSATCIMMAENGVANTPDVLFYFRQSTIHLSSSVNLDPLHQTLIANDQQFKFFKALDWGKPTDERDIQFASALSESRLNAKCKYDAYNLVIKHLPISKLHWIKDCTFLKTKDKLEMALRYFYDKIFK